MLSDLALRRARASSDFCRNDDFVAAAVVVVTASEGASVDATCGVLSTEGAADEPAGRSRRFVPDSLCTNAFATAAAPRFVAGATGGAVSGEAGDVGSDVTVVMGTSSNLDAGGAGAWVLSTLELRRELDSSSESDATLLTPAELAMESRCNGTTEPFAPACIDLLGGSAGAGAAAVADSSSLPRSAGGATGVA